MGADLNLLIKDMIEKSPQFKLLKLWTSTSSTTSCPCSWARPASTWFARLTWSFEKRFASCAPADWFLEKLLVSSQGFSRWQCLFPVELKYKFTRRRGAADTDRTGVEPGLPTGQLQLLNIWISSSLIWEQQSVKEYSCSRVLVHLVLWSQMLHSQTRARLPYSSSAQPEPHLQLHSQLVKADQELNQGAYTLHRMVHIICNQVSYILSRSFILTP